MLYTVIADIHRSNFEPLAEKNIRITAQLPFAPVEGTELAPASEVPDLSPFHLKLKNLEWQVTSGGGGYFYSFETELVDCDSVKDLENAFHPKGWSVEEVPDE